MAPAVSRSLKSVCDGLPPGQFRLCTGGKRPFRIWIRPKPVVIWCTKNCGSLNFKTI